MQVDGRKLKQTVGAAFIKVPAILLGFIYRLLAKNVFLQEKFVEKKIIFFCCTNIFFV